MSVLDLVNNQNLSVPSLYHNNQLFSSSGINSIDWKIVAQHTGNHTFGSSFHISMNDISHIMSPSETFLVLPIRFLRDKILLGANGVAGPPITSGTGLKENNVIIPTLRSVYDIIDKIDIQIDSKKVFDCNNVNWFLRKMDEQHGGMLNYNSKQDLNTPITATAATLSDGIFSNVHKKKADRAMLNSLIPEVAPAEETPFPLHSAHENGDLSHYALMIPFTYMGFNESLYSVFLDKEIKISVVLKEANRCFVNAVLGTDGEKYQTDSQNADDQAALSFKLNSTDATRFQVTQPYIYGAMYNVSSGTINHIVENIVNESQSAEGLLSGQSYKFLSPTDHALTLPTVIPDENAAPTLYRLSTSLNYSRLEYLMLYFTVDQTLCNNPYLKSAKFSDTGVADEPYTGPKAGKHQVAKYSQSDSLFFDITDLVVRLGGQQIPLSCRGLNSIPLRHKMYREVFGDSANFADFVNSDYVICLNLFLDKFLDFRSNMSSTLVSPGTTLLDVEFKAKVPHGFTSKLGENDSALVTRAQIKCHLHTWSPSLLYHKSFGSSVVLN